MKTWKLVSGITSIVLFAFVMFQSCAAGISNSLENFSDYQKQWDITKLRS